MRFPSQQLAASEMEKWEKKSKGMISLALGLTSDDQWDSISGFLENQVKVIKMQGNDQFGTELDVR